MLARFQLCFEESGRVESAESARGDAGKPRGACSAGCSGIRWDLGGNCTCSAKWTLARSERKGREGKEGGGDFGKSLQDFANFFADYAAEVDVFAIKLQKLPRLTRRA